MTKNSKFMTKVNRMPAGTKLERQSYGKHGMLHWKGVIITPGDNANIGPITNLDLGTVCDHLLILHRRRQNEDENN